MSLWGRLLPWEGQVAGCLEEAGVGWDKEGDRGKERAGRLASSCPLYSGCPLSPRPQQRSLNGPGGEQGVCQC